VPGRAKAFQTVWFWWQGTGKFIEVQRMMKLAGPVFLGIPKDASKMNGILDEDTPEKRTRTSTSV